MGFDPSRSVDRTLVGRIAALTFGAAACLMVWYASHNGIGMTPDSMTYLEGARSLLRDHRLWVDDSPLTHFPPLYPVVLAAAGRLTGSLLTAARLLHCCLFALTVLTIGWAVREGSGKPTPAAAIAMWCTLVSAGITQVHLFALSEPLFLILLITAALALDRHLRAGGPRWLLMAGALTAAAGLTRYVGVCLMCSMVVALVILNRRPMAARLRSAAVFIVVSATPLVVWTVRNALVEGKVVDRSLAFHPPGFEALRMFTYTLSFWAWPTPNLPAAARAGMALLMLVVLAVAFCATMVFIHRHQQPVGVPSHVGGVLLIFAGVYVPFLLVSRSLVDAHTKLDNRILSPILIIGIVLAFARPPVWSDVASRRMAGVLPVVAWFAISIANIPWTAHILAEGHSTGFGYASAEWRESKVVAFVDGLDPEVMVYSNAPEVFRVLRHRPALMIPRAYSPSSGQPNSAFGEQINEMMARLESGTAALAYFERMRSREYLPTPEELAESHDLVVLFRASDGAVFSCRRRPGAEPLSSESLPADG